MSKLEQLIEELCPNGVEIKKIEELTLYEQPTEYIVKSTKYDDSYETPVLTAGKTFILGYTNEKEGIYNATKENPVIIFDDFTGSYKWVDFPFKVKSSAIKIITMRKEQILIRFFYHMMGVLNFTSNEHRRLWINKYSKMEISVPPLEVQCEIVRILDKFTLLTAELTARRKQYEYYRNNLLSLKDIETIKYRKLKEIAKFRRGSFPQPYGNSEWYDGEGAMPFVQVADIGKDMMLVDDTKRKISKLAQPKSIFAPKGSILISLQGSIGRVAVTQYDSYIDRTVAIFTELSNEVIPKYFAYQIQNVFSIKEKTARGSTIKTITKEEFSDFEILVPPLQEQERIVSILDKFNNLNSSMYTGIPAEIEARQKQYEYYRDKLLTFKEKNNE